LNQQTYTHEHLVSSRQAVCSCVLIIRIHTKKRISANPQTPYLLTEETTNVNRNLTLASLGII